MPPSDDPKPTLPVSPAALDFTEAKLMPEQPATQTSGNRPRIMLSAVEGHYNQWKGDVFTLHHLGGDAAQYLETAPINFEGFNQVSLRFEAVPFIGPTKPDAMVHFHVVTNDDGVPRHADKPSFVMMSFVYDAQHLGKPEVSYPVVVRYKCMRQTNHIELDEENGA
ncbi:MAG: hypothetical protein H0X25_21045 [Acidobacteriales bacterium]|nr:hypothetical protein [Terriglobales bacterium]